MLEQLKHCPLCNSGQFSNYKVCTDYTVSKEEFTLVQCTSCNFVFTNPRPSPAELGKYYQSQDYISHSDRSNSPINFLYKIARGFTLKGKVNLINKLAKKGNLLDIGCGTGYFLSASQKAGWNVTGVEPDEQARGLASSKVHKQIYTDILEVQNKRFDIITMWHVLEHIPDLNAFIQALSERMNPDGHLIIAVPNYKSYDAKYYGRYWAAYDVPRHLYHFDQDSMYNLMKKYGLTIKSIKPMNLDAYYVSLLSETYKGSKLSKFIKAPFIGLKSNIKAKQNNNNYSSLIYIISK